MIAELWPFLALGLAGSPHCVGMCGGFALAAGRRAGTNASGASASPCPRRQTSYVVGKALGYAAVGGAAAAGAGLLAGGDRTELARWLHTGVLVLCGLVLVGFGLDQLNLRPPLPSSAGRALERLTRPFRTLVDGARALPGVSGPLALGTINALLPCGLSWAAFALAATELPHVAALGCFLFGLATAPALVAFAWFPRLLPTSLRRFAPHALGVLLLAFGGSTLLHALRAASAPPDAPPCCCESPSLERTGDGASNLGTHDPGSPDQ